MKAIVLADRRPEKLVSEVLKENQDIDLIITLGDLSWDYINDFQNIKIPKIGVYGNHCYKYMEDLNIYNAFMKTVKFKDYIIGGLEGCVQYKINADNQYSQEEYNLMLTNFPYVDIFITHCPPFGINDDADDESHNGIKALRKYLDDKQPKYLLHGHTYPEIPITQYNNTKIYYIHGLEIINFD